jgi:hypothetical protein
VLQGWRGRGAGAMVFDPLGYGQEHPQVVEESVLLVKPWHPPFFRHLLVPLCFRDAVSGVVVMHCLHDRAPVFPRRVIGHPGMCVCLRKRETAHVAPESRVWIRVLNRDVPHPAGDLEVVSVEELVASVGCCPVNDNGRVGCVVAVAPSWASVPVPVIGLAASGKTTAETEAGRALASDVIASTVQVDHLVALRTVLEICPTHESLNVPVDC